MEPFPAHQVIGNVYFVGTEALGTFLVTTPEGHILINSDFETTVPLIRASVEALGLKFDDIKIVLGSHAHGDHMEADALVKQLTGAQVMAMEEDVPALQRMRPGDKEHPMDRILRDGDEVALGGTILTAHRTPGDTRGCTSWGLQVEENGDIYNALIVCSFGVNDNYVLVGNEDYPEIASDYMATFAKARTSPVDVFPGSHGFFYDLAAKHAKLQGRRAGESVRRSRRLSRARRCAGTALSHDAEGATRSSTVARVSSAHLHRQHRHARPGTLLSAAKGVYASVQ